MGPHPYQCRLLFQTTGLTEPCTAQPRQLTIYHPWSVAFLFMLLYRSWGPRGRLLKCRSCGSCCAARRNSQAACSCCPACCHALLVELCSHRRRVAASAAMSTVLAPGRTSGVAPAGVPNTPAAAPATGPTRRRGMGHKPRDLLRLCITTERGVGPVRGSGAWKPVPSSRGTDNPSMIAVRECTTAKDAG